MKLSFSTRGWRELPWAEQVRDASELRFQGIEVYNLHRCASLTERGGAFHKYSRNETLRELIGRVEASGDPASVRFRAVAERCLAARFGGRSIGRDEAKRLSATLRE